MTAVFILGINMFVAAVFATAFGVVAATIRTSRGAQWMAAGYSVGVFYVLIQFVSAAFGDQLLLNSISFVTYLVAVALCVVGVSHHYRVRPPLRSILLILGLCTLFAPAFVIAYDQSLWGVALYQMTYAAMQMLCFWVILRSGQRKPLDILLLALQVITSLTYPLRPLLGIFVGEPGRADAYIASTYAAVSQTIGAVSLVSLALVLLLVIMRDNNAEMQKHSETDLLSGALNRRGFETYADIALTEAAATGTTLTMIVTDLDHFKTINDNFGHAAGDRVIAAFAGVLKEVAPENAIVGRLGGEEFAVILAGMPLAAARLYAETARVTFANLETHGVPQAVSASFGVAELAADEGLAEILRRADTALYAAKAAGRNRVCSGMEGFDKPVPANNAA